MHLWLLERGRLQPLHAHAPLLMSWPVNHAHEADARNRARRRRA